MSTIQRAWLGKKLVVCPLCRCDRFASMNFLVESQFLQIMEWEVFGDKGIMLICARCSRIQHFANRAAVVLGG